MGIGVIIIAINITKAENDCQEKNIFTLSYILNLYFLAIEIKNAASRDHSLAVRPTSPWRTHHFQYPLTEDDSFL